VFTENSKKSIGGPRFVVISVEEKVNFSSLQAEKNLAMFLIHKLLLTSISVKNFE
jgi:hypothetical protein